MRQLMQDARGVGLAATQVGILQRIFVFQRDEDEVIEVVNPVLSQQSDELVTDDEGCLSLQGVTMPVERHLSLTIEGQRPRRQRAAARARGSSGARGAARDRSSRRHADPRSDRRDVAQGSARGAPPAADSHARLDPTNRRRGHVAVRRGRPRTTRRPARDRVSADAAGRPFGTRPKGLGAARKARGRAAGSARFAARTSLG